MKNFFKITLIALIIISCSSKDIDINDFPSYPSFSSKIEVTIKGLSFDAMELFISPNGKLSVL